MKLVEFSVEGRQDLVPEGTLTWFFLYKRDLTVVQPSRHTPGLRNIKEIAYGCHTCFYRGNKTW